MIPLCAANDPDLNNCAKESAQKLIPQITRGNKYTVWHPLDKKPGFLCLIREDRVYYEKNPHEKKLLMKPRQVLNEDLKKFEDS